MDLDELKTAWRSLERELAAHNAFERRAAQRAGARTAVRALRPLFVGQLVQLVVALALLPVFASFWVAHRDVPSLLVSGIAMQAYVTALMGLAIRELHMIRSIDCGEPVLAIQRRIEELRSWRVRVGPFYAISGCFIWIPLMLVIFGALGADVWTHRPSVVLWFAASALVALGVVLWILRWERRSDRDGSAIAGVSVARARKALAEIAAFEREVDRL